MVRPASLEAGTIKRKVLIVRKTRDVAIMLLIAMIATAGALPQGLAKVSPVKDEAAWQWFQNCRENKAMRLEVLLDGKIIYRSSFPICRANTGSNPAEGRQRTIAFYFKGGRVFQGEYHTARTQIIEGNIWQAGADPDAMLLGVSFSSKKQVLLNTIHVAKPDSVSASEIDRGIVVRTLPPPGARSR
jgi:hypothetical protein